MSSMELTQNEFHQDMLYLPYYLFIILLTFAWLNISMIQLLSMVYFGFTQNTTTT